MRKEKDADCCLFRSIQSLSSDIELLKREKISKIAAFESRHDNLTALVNNLKELQQSVEEERNIKVQ